jgi:hypothetical protein
MEHLEFTGVDVISIHPRPKVMGASHLESSDIFLPLSFLSSFASPHLSAPQGIEEHSKFHLLRLLAVNNRSMCFVSVVTSFPTRKRLT